MSPLLILPSLPKHADKQNKTINNFKSLLAGSTCPEGIIYVPLREMVKSSVVL